VNTLFALLLYLNPDPDPTMFKRDHGPGTSGGGLTTISGEVLRPNVLTVDFRIDYTQFQHLTESQIQDRTFQVGNPEHAHFDAARNSALETFSLAYGVAEGIQLGFSFGYYLGNDVREGHLHGDGSYGFHKFGDITGMTDHWITSKFQLMKNESGSLAGVAGIKLPFGDDDEVSQNSTNNAPLEASLQPGSGAVDFLLGVAYSRYLTSEITLDASVAYTLRTEANNFKIGDLISVGVATAYRFTESVQVFPQPSVFLELNVRHLFKNWEDGEYVINSGGTALFVSPGFRIAFSERVAWTIAIQIPVVQALNDEQQKTLFKVSTGFTFTF